MKKEYENSIFQRFGLTAEDYYKLLAGQNGNCAICNTNQSKLKRVLFIDHDHKTGLVRGLICDSCNVGLSRFKDSCEILESAIFIPN